MQKRVEVGLGNKQITPSVTEFLHHSCEAIVEPVSCLAAVRFLCKVQSNISEIAQFSGPFWNMTKSWNMNLEQQESSGF